MAKIAFVMDNMFEDSEFRFPYDRANEAGHETVIVGLEKNKDLEGKKGQEKVTTDVGVDEVDAASFDGVVIPGGYSPDLIRTNEKIVSFVRTLFEGQKPVAAICHAGWVLAEADIARGKTVTSWPSIKTDLVNAGANWVDQEVVEDGNLITSRVPGDLPAFNRAVVKALQ